MKKYKTTDKFWKIISIVFLIIMVVVLRHVDIENLFTSVYWR